MELPSAPRSSADATGEDHAAVHAFATAVRAHCLRMTNRAGSSHIGSCLSVADILAVLYCRTLRVRPDDPSWADRDRLVISKGHAAAATYASLAEAGFFPVDRLSEFGRDGTALAGHVTHAGIPGVEVSTGSLGHGLPIATGLALSALRAGATWRVYVVMSDGEMDEGSNWEALMFAAHHGLDNLTAIIDYNGIQSLAPVHETLTLEPLGDKLRAFGWTVYDIDGHSVPQLTHASSPAGTTPGKPTAIIARTVKGKGVSFMEGKVLWHYRPPSTDELTNALDELGFRA